uniref:Uncharacterized protein n=1 Tax=Strongyloides papillosus TaxID=174720 RepID=A0A0N5B6I1_STREA
MPDNKQDNEFAVSLVSFQCKPTDQPNAKKVEKSPVQSRSRSRTQTLKYSSSNNLNNIAAPKETRERSLSSKRNQKRTTVAFGLTTNYADTVLGKLEEKLGDNLDKKSPLTSQNSYQNRRMSTSSSGNNSSNRHCMTDRQDESTIASEIKRNSHRITRLESLLANIEKKSMQKMESIDGKLDSILNNIPSLQNDIDNNINQKENVLSDEKLKEIIVQKLENDVEFKKWLKKEFAKSNNEENKGSSVVDSKIITTSKVTSFKDNFPSPGRNIPLSINSKNYLARQFGKENIEFTAQQSFVQSLISMDLKEPGSPVVFETNYTKVKKNIQTPKSRYVSEDLLNSPIDQSIIYEETVNRQRNKK